MKFKLKLSQKISVFTILLVFISVLISVVFSGNWYINQMMHSIEENTLNTVKITAIAPIIVEGLENGDPDAAIQKYIEKTQQNLEGIDIMVVADQEGVRYGHTKSDRVGKLFSAVDNDKAILYGETYVSVGPGTLGDSLRAFAPVKNNRGEILGFVMAGALLDSIEQAKISIRWMVIGFVLISSLVGIIGALFLSSYIKKSLLYYEPEDISRLYLENQGVLSTVREGVIAIDQNNIITLINETAKRYLGVPSCVGEDIRDVFPMSKLPEVIKTKQSVLDVQFALLDRMVLANNVPIINDKNELIGGVCSFRDQTDLNNLAQEITGVNKIVDALRATTHEFKNKLHVILGFIETKRLSEAKRYIGDINEALQITISDIMAHIEEPTLAALSIGKSQRCQELKIIWQLDERTNFNNRHKIDVNALVLIVGNLLTNAMEHLDQVDQDLKKIRLYMSDETNQVIIEVADNGHGVEDKGKLFDKGYTTKSQNRGYGLYLLKEQVDRYRGTIEVDTSSKGTCFSIMIKMGE